jgi:DNA sulfur modification protein DndC
LSCTRGGECGQGVWFWQSKGLGISFAAPIVDWSDCDVWDFLRFVLPAKGYPTLKLYEIYRNGNDMRFGCWMCTVVRQDRTMTKLTEANDLKYLKPLLEYRNYVIEATNCRLHPESRVTRPDGNPGRLSMNTRRTLFDRLLAVEKESGLTLIAEEEKTAILRYWSEFQNLRVCEPTTGIIQYAVSK